MIFWSSTQYGSRMYVTYHSWFHDKQGFSGGLWGCITSCCCWLALSYVFHSRDTVSSLWAVLTTCHDAGANLMNMEIPEETKYQPLFFLLFVTFVVWLIVVKCLLSSQNHVPYCSIIVGSKITKTKNFIASLLKWFKILNTNWKTD